MHWPPGPKGVGSRINAGVDAINGLMFELNRILPAVRSRADLGSPRVKGRYPQEGECEYGRTEQR